MISTRVIFDIDQSTVSRDDSRLSAIIIANVADPELESVLQRTELLQRHRIKNFKELQEVCYDLADVITDASETPCNRPTDKDVQKKYYSGKQTAHTIKTQITISSSKRVIAVSNSYPRSVHDKSVFDCDETVKKNPHQARYFLDNGYVGVDRENLGVNILIPFRKKRGRKELPLWTTQINKFLSKHRIAVEHVLSKIKNFRICAYTYRGRRENFNQIFKNVVALYNFNCATE